MKRPQKEQFQKSQDARREALQKNLARFTNTNKGNKKAKQKSKNKNKQNSAHDNGKLTKSDNGVIEFECTATFADERNEALEYLEAQPTYNSLSAELSGLARNKNVSASLVWPAFLSCVPAIHTLATSAAYERGDKLGIRAIFYPAKSNAFRELNHIRINAQWLYDIAQKWQSLSREGHIDDVISECEHKDILYLTLHYYLDEDSDPNGFPSIGETYPTFPVGRQVWGDFSDRIFNGVFKHVPKRGNPIDDLGSPYSAPDAIFGIHPDLSVEETIQRLNSEELLPENGRPPDVAIVNLDAKSRKNLGSKWASRAARFIKLCQYELPYSPIGVQVLVDDPIAFLAIRKKLGEHLGHNKGRSQKNNALSYQPRMNLDSSICSQRRLPQRTILDTRLESHVVDAEAAAVAAEFNQSARAVQADSEDLAKSLRDCAGYLLWSARLPSGQVALQELLHDDSRSDQALQWSTNTYSWIGVVRRLEAIRSGLGESGDGPNIDHLVEKATKMLDSYSSGTPSGMKLLELVGEIIVGTDALRSKKKKRSRPTITVAVPSALQARLVIDMLEKKWPLFDAHGNEVIQVLRTVELFSRGAPIIARRLIVIGARAQTIAELCSAHNLPKRIELIMGAGDAERIVKRLDFVLGEHEFEQLHKPIGVLVKRLKDFLESTSTQFSILSKLVYWRPQSHSQASSPTLAATTSPPDFEMLLDDGRLIGAFKTRAILVYDETRRPPFTQTTGSEIEVGDHILVISDEMRDDIEVYMDLAGRFKNENVVRKYHQHVIEQLNTLYPDQSQIQMINGIQSDINSASPTLEEITEYKIRYWITVDRELDQPFDQLLSHAPGVREDYDRFMRLLRIDDQLADLYWDLGINSLRRDRRHEGRQATLVYQRLLMDPDSVSALLSIPAAEQSRLLVQARSNVFEIIGKTRHQ